MRIVPIITALGVSGLIYLAVLDRERLLGFAGAVPEDQAAAAAQAAPEPVAAAAAPAPIAVVTRQVAVQDVDSAVLLRGRTEAVRMVEVRAEVGGLVVSEPLRRGAQVVAGDVLCRLEPGTRDVALVEARARLAEAQLEATAAERLASGGFASDTRVAGAQAALEAAAAAVARAEDDLARLEMRAPFDGVLEDDTAELGALLQPGGLCASVIQMDPIRLVGFVPELQVDRVAVGARAGARLASGRELVGTVSFVARSADPATRTFRVEVAVPNPDLSVRDGLTADILIAATGARGALVPGSALTLDNDGRLGLRVVDADDVVQFVPVAILRDAREGVWVTGLPETGARVIVVGQDFVTAGVRVRPVDEAEVDATIARPAQ